MRQTLTSLKAEWINVGSSKSEPDVRIPPLNIMAVLTLDTVNREWQQQQNLPPAEQSVALRQDLREIEDGAIEKQSEVLTLLPHSMWRDSFQFDVKYDLARMYGLRFSLVSRLRGGQDPFSLAAFQVLKAAFANALLVASKLQRDSVARDMDRRSGLKQLAQEQKLALRALI